MLILMFWAFFSTCFADFSTNATDLHRLPASKTHQLSCSIADRWTFHIELDTSRHHVDIRLPGAGRSAMVTYWRATQTGVYAGLVVVIIFHGTCFCYPCPATIIAPEIPESHFHPAWCGWLLLISSDATTQHRTCLWQNVHRCRLYIRCVDTVLLLQALKEALRLHASGQCNDPGNGRFIYEDIYASWK